MVPTKKSQTSATLLFQSSVPTTDISGSSNSSDNPPPSPPMGVADFYLRDLGNNSNIDEVNGDYVNTDNFRVDRANGDEVVAVPIASSSIQMGGETSSGEANDEDLYYGNATVHLDNTVLEDVEPLSLDAVKDMADHDENESEEESNDAEPDTKFYSLWQRRPGRVGENQSNDVDEGVLSSESNISKSISTIMKNKMNVQDEADLQDADAAARKWSEWMISGRKARDDNNSKADSFPSPSFEITAAADSSSSTLSNESSGSVAIGNSVSDTTSSLEILPAEAAVRNSGGYDIEPKKGNESDDIISPASPSSAEVFNSVEHSNSTVGSTATISLEENSSAEEMESASVGWWSGWGLKLFSNNSNNNSSMKGGKSVRRLLGMGFMDKTITMMTMRRQKKQPIYTKENESKSTKQSSSTKSISIERRREQLREPGRISASDWRQNIINLPSSTILRDVRNPVTWVFVWATLWSIMHECLKRLAEVSTSTLSSGLGRRGAGTSITSTTMGLGPSAARWLSAAAWSAKHMCLPTVQHTMMVSAVSLLLVFRTNSAYQRFAEGRKIWNDIVDTSRDFSRMIKLYEFAIGTSKCRRINSLLASFPYLLRHRIRPSLMTFYRVNDSNIERDPEHSLLLYPDESLRDTDPELMALAKDEEETGFIRRKTRELCWVDRRTLPWKLIPGSALELCARAQNRPLWVCDRMAKELAVVEDFTTKFTNRERMALIGYVDKLSRSIGACERIHQTVVPMNYARHALRSLTVWLWTLPFVLVKDLGLLTGPVVAVLSWILFGVYEIGSRIEDPFQGTLRLSVYCDAIRRDVLADAIARDTAFILEEEGKTSTDTKGEYDAIFELDSESEEYDGDDLPPKKKKKTQIKWSFPGDIRL